MVEEPGEALAVVDSKSQHNYKSSLAELERLTQQKLLQAEEEHKALTNTIRQRLIASLTKKRQQLLRDKEQLDIADGSAFLLHPNHFSINTPGFPPNGVQNRKTRHLRHRQGSPNAGDLDGKKKRKATAMEEEGNESPAPTSFYPPVNDARTARSPLREARDKSAYAQYEAPAYSLERIFTEKELAMATDAAKIATWRYFNQPQEQARQQYDPEANGVANNNSAVDDAMDTGDDDEGMADGVAPTTEGVDQDSPPNEDVAPEMDRSASHQVLTRGGARANPLAALNDLAALATSERAAGIGRTASKDPFAPVIPSHHAVTRTEKSGAPPPGGVTSADMETDFAMIRQSASRLARETADVTSTSANANADADADEEETATNMRRQLLEQALGETGVRQPYRLPLLETGPAVVGRGIDRPPLTGFAPMMNVEHKARPQPTVPAQGMAGSMAAALRGIGLGGGEAMSRTTSVAGGSEAGERPPAAKRGRAKQMV